jgi:predicted RNase H-like nuclease (RuvC/YqgF family)
VYFLLSPSSTNPILVEIQNAENELAKLQTQMEVDKNETQNKELELSQLNRTFREKRDDANSEEEEITEKLSGIAAKSAELDRQIAGKKAELEPLEQELAQSRLPLEEIKQQGKPLLEKESSLMESIKELESKLATQKGKADSVASELAVLENKRRIAEENFLSEKQRLTTDVKLPFHLHFADKKEVIVRNKVPSGKGIFVNAGFRDGFRNGMEFLGEKLSDKNAIPFRAELGLVQDNYSYLKFVSSGETGFSPDSLEEDEGILLTRSGKLSHFKGLSDSNSTRISED